MRINHNIMAYNTHMQYTVSGLVKSKATEKLSSGLRINRAGDDASGLAQSEKMRGLIRGLEQASRNVDDGISLVQTAEGAMQEIHNMLGRMRELMVQAATDSYDSPVDRPAIQQEIDVLKAEIDDIAYQTEFNGVKLLNGGAVVDEMQSPFWDVDGGVGHANPRYTFTLGPGEKKNVGYFIYEDPTASLSDFTMFMSSDALPGESTASRTLFLTAPNGEEFSVTSGDDSSENNFLSGLGSVYLSGNSYSSTITVFPDRITDDAGVALSTTDEHDIAYDGTWIVSVQNNSSEEEEFSITMSAIGVRVENGGSDDGYFAGGFIEQKEAPPKDLIIQSGANDSNTIPLRTYDCRTSTLGIDNLQADPRENASQALERINKAIEIVSGYRADAGARQNRLEITKQNVDNAALNLTAAESQIRDVDMAEQMTEYYTYSVLKDASTAMLAQANGMPQSVLNLIG